MKKTPEHLIGILALFISLMGNPVVAEELSTAATEQSNTEFKDRNSEEPAALAAEAAKKTPGDWFAHAVLSYHEWQKGNIVSAVEEGEIARTLAPQEYLALSNLALIKEALDDPSAALPLYEQAGKLQPANWLPAIGAARCYIKTGKEKECFDTLQSMTQKQGMDFNWYYELADIYLRLDKPELALNPAAAAMRLAGTAVQKSSSSIDALSAFLRSRQNDHAAGLARKVFNEYQPQDPQLYVLTGRSLLQANNPEKGAWLFSSALANLKNQEDADAFFRLGKVFEEKAAQAQPSNASAWSQLAEKAYDECSSRLPQARYYLGLASALSREGKIERMRTALETANARNEGDTLGKFLLEKTSKNACVDSVGVHVDLSKIEFTLDNLNCSCHVSKVAAALQKTDGVGFVHVNLQAKPYKGIMLIDPTKTSAEKAFSQTADIIKKEYAMMVPPLSPSFKAIGNEPVKTVADCISTAQKAQFGDIDHFFQVFKALSPIEPKANLASQNKQAGIQ